jgi:hypothetical protein
VSCLTYIIGQKTTTEVWGRFIKAQSIDVIFVPKEYVVNNLYCEKLTIIVPKPFKRATFSTPNVPIALIKRLAFLATNHKC